jgi:ankyrin repeat protein
MKSDAREQIIDACKAGDARAVAQLLDASPDWLTPALWPPAIFQGRSLEVTRLLLDRGLSPDECSAPRKPLHLAASREKLDIVRLLLERGARLDVIDGENITPYELMCCFGRAATTAGECRQLFRDAGAKDTIFTHIYLGHDEEAIAMLRENPSLPTTHGPVWFTPLQTAARAARPAVVKALLETGAPVDDPRPNACSALWLVCQSDADPVRRTDVATQLLDAGADPCRLCDDEQTTPLHFAAFRGPLSMVKLLLSRGAKDGQKDKAGNTALFYARECQPKEKQQIIEFLERPAP